MKLIKSFVYCVFVILLWSCHQSQDSKPDSVKLTELSDQEIMDIIRGYEVNPDNFHLDTLRAYITKMKDNPDGQYSFSTEDDLRKFVQVIEEDTKSLRQRNKELRDSLGHW